MSSTFRRFVGRCLPVLSAILMVDAPARAQGQTAAPAATEPIPVVDLRRASVTLDSERELLVIESPAIDLPAATSGMPVMADLPPSMAVIPADLSLYSVRFDVVDSAGRILPKPFLHHFNLTIPSRRDLFLPIAQRFLAASKETPAIELPSLVIGMPLERDAQLLVTGMISNATPTAQRGLRIRATLGTRRAGFFPFFRAYPFVMDAQFPDERHPSGALPFDLPPGRSSFSWESHPAIPGTILGVGGHIHDYGVGLELTDVTTGAVLWHADIVRDDSGHMVSLPVTRFYNWHRLGIHVEPTHHYRITVTYDNPTGHTLHEAAMGSVAGLFVPDRSARWPGVNLDDAVYRQDLATILAPSDMSHMEMSP